MDLMDGSTFGGTVDRRRDEILAESFISLLDTLYPLFGLSDEELIEECEVEVFKAGDDMDEDIHHTDEEETKSPLPNKDQPKSSHAQDTKSDYNSSCPEALKKNDHWEKHEEATASYADLKNEIEGFHDAAYKVHKGTEAAFNTYEKLLVKFQAQYGKDAKKILGSLKVIQDAVKEDPALNKKVIKATKAYTKNSTNLTKLLSLIKSFNFLGLKTLVESLQASPLRQDEHLSKWANTQSALQSEISSLKQDTSEIKSMMTEIFKAFRGQSSLGSSSSVPTTIHVINEGPSTVRGENFTHDATKEPPSQTKGENDDIETQETEVEKEPKNVTIE
ncbi:hypothetical protein Tco_0474383 [Tanacetum coccineum]